MAHVAFGAGWTGEMVDLIDVVNEVDGVGDVEVVIAELLIGVEVFDIGVAAGDEVIDGDDLMAINEEPVAQMLTDESRSARNQNTQ